MNSRKACRNSTMVTSTSRLNHSKDHSLSVSFDDAKIVLFPLISKGRRVQYYLLHVHIVLRVRRMEPKVAKFLQGSEVLSSCHDHRLNSTRPTHPQKSTFISFKLRSAITFNRYYTVAVQPDRTSKSLHKSIPRRKRSGQVV